MPKVRHRFHPYHDMPRQDENLAPEQESVEHLARKAFKQLSLHNLATMRGEEVQTLPVAATEAFAKQIKVLKQQVRRPLEKNTVYTELYLPLRDKIRKDNIDELELQLQSPDLSETERQEIKSKIEAFAKKDYGSFISMLWLMNHDGRNKNRREVNHHELAAVNWLNDRIRKFVQNQKRRDTSRFNPVRKKLQF